MSRQGRKKVHLELELASIDDVKGQYEAVSYMWGPPSPERHVIINSKTLRLCDNIWRCLKHLRDCELTRSRLWIDTICIDQSDDHEKSQQVAKMGQIFQNASRVLIWLGSTSLQTHMHEPGSETLRDSIETLAPENWDIWTDVLGHSDSRSRSLENQIMSIVYNPYWYRLWIIQEVALAREACIVFGKALLGTDYITAIYMAARENSKPGYRSWIVRQRDPNIKTTTTGLLDHHPMIRIGHNDSMMQEGDRGDCLAELIRTYHWQCCTDPRDYIFGLVGLLHSCPQFEIDYASSNEEVAVRALQYLKEEATRKSKHYMGLDLVAAAALMKALTVTSSTYSIAKQTLPIDRAEALKETSFDLLFWHMKLLATAEGVPKPETKPYEDEWELNISGSLAKKLYLMKHEEVLTLKLLNGQIKQFTLIRKSTSDVNARDSIPPEIKPGVVLLCYLHFLPVFIINRSSSDDGTIQIEHFLMQDTTPAPHEPSQLLETRFPTRAQDALRREINVRALDWNEVSQGISPNSFLHLSTSELTSLCEVLAPQPDDVDEFMRNG